MDAKRPTSPQTQLIAAILDDQNATDRLREDLAHVSSMAEVQWGRFLSTLQHAIMERQTSRQLSEQLDAQGIRPSEATRTTRLALSFLRAFSGEDREDIEQVIQDLEALALIPDPPELASRANAIIRSLSHEADSWFSTFARKEDVRSGVFPRLEQFDTTVELRGVFAHELRVTEKADDLAPKLKILDTESIISVACVVDSGFPKRFCFQTDVVAVEALIEKLRYAILQAKALEGKGITE